jgi:hypothetical protein
MNPHRRRKKLHSSPSSASLFIKSGGAGHQWLTPVILATQEAEIRRITVQSQPRQILSETLSQKIPTLQRAVGVAQGMGPEFKPQYQNRWEGMVFWHYPQPMWFQRTVEQQPSSPFLQTRKLRAMWLKQEPQSCPLYTAPGPSLPGSVPHRVSLGSGVR